jgi:hypothetical protein
MTCRAHFFIVALGITRFMPDELVSQTSVIRLAPPVVLEDLPERAHQSPHRRERSALRHQGK